MEPLTQLYAPAEFNPESQPEAAQPSMGLRARIGNTIRNGYDAITDRIDNLAYKGKALIAIGGIALVGAQAAELAVNADPVVADGNVPALTGGNTLLGAPETDPTTSTATTTDQAALEQKCEDEALARPSVKQALVMRNAGTRPVPSYHSQYIDGQLSFKALDAGCAEADLERFSEGTVEEFENKHWQPITGHTTPFFAVNDAGSPRVFYGPSHSFPQYQFNDYMPGKGFHKVRLVLTNELKSGTPEGANSRKTVAKNQDIFHVSVTGNPRKAAASKQLALNEGK